MQNNLKIILLSRFFTRSELSNVLPDLSSTLKYPPIEVLEVYQNGSFLLENKVAKDYINRYGEDWVRGGKFFYMDLKYC